MFVSTTHRALSAYISRVELPSLLWCSQVFACFTNTQRRAVMWTQQPAPAEQIQYHPVIGSSPSCSSNCTVRVAT